MEGSFEILEGLISVRAALESMNRDIREIVIRKDKCDKATLSLEAQAGALGVKVKRAESGYIDRYADGKTHGGMIAFVGPRRYLELPDLVHGDADNFVVMLDGVEDPYNFGYAIRSLYAAGVGGLVVPPRNWMSAANVVTRASAGASERIAIAMAGSSLEASVFFKSVGLTIACTAQQNATSLYETNLNQPLFMVVGGEKRGISRALMQMADMHLRIPYGRTFDQSLSTNSAVAVLSFEVMRQRMWRIWKTGN